MNQPKPRRPRLALLVHSARVGIVVALLLAIPSPARNVLDDAGQAPSIETIQASLPSAHSIDAEPDASGLWSIYDQAGDSLGKVARTLPNAADVVGYRGPTESLIVFDDQSRITHVRLLGSSDTHEHVDAVIADQDFFRQFRGWPLGGPTSDVSIDAVSGATLTSLALAEGVLKRIGGERPSLVFPDPLSQDEIQEWFDDSENVAGTDAVTIVRDSSGNVIGKLIRTGALSDDITGFQGPTELIIRFSGDNDPVAERIRLRQSYDNEPYVDDVRTETEFWALFEKKTLSELAAFDPQTTGVEGVSGATMTSLAVADTIVAAARAIHRPRNIRWNSADIGTIAVLILLVVASHLGWFRNHWLRRIWLLVVVAVIGLWAGNLVSLALIAGWSAEGIAWHLAPGLATITAVTMLLPPLNKGNAYCNHVCPHGAIQQLIRPAAKTKRHIRVPHRLSTALHWIPGAMLVVAYVMLISTATIDLSSWEPFHAYLYRIAGVTSFALAGATLLLSAFVPMGYCRFGCPTGRLLDHLRRTAQSDKILLADVVSVALLCIALLLRYSAQLSIV